MRTDMPMQRRTQITRVSPTRTTTDRTVPRARRGHRCQPEALSTPALLHLMWLTSPALPVGGFSYSEGFESAVESGLVGSEAEAGDWLRDQLRLGLARNELAVVAKAHSAWGRADVQQIGALNDWVTTTRETHELRRQTAQMGRSMVEWLKNRGGALDPRIALLQALSPAPTWPIAFALAAAQTTAPRRVVLLSFAFGWAENMVQAALKTVPLGQAAGQRILASLVRDLPAAVDRAAACTSAERQAFTPMLAILSAQHETQYSRLFRS